MTRSFRKGVAIVVLLSMTAACSKTSGREVDVYGDSTAIASRIPLLQKFWNVYPYLDGGRWWNILRHSYAPPLQLVNYGEKGRSVLSLERLVSSHRPSTNAVVILYDRANTDESAEYYIAHITKVVGELGTSRFLLMPQIANTAPVEDLKTATKMAVINQFIVKRWPSNTFDSAYRDAYLVELGRPNTRADGIHRNYIGQAIEARYIRKWLELHHWMER